MFLLCLGWSAGGGPSSEPGVEAEEGLYGSVAKCEFQMTQEFPENKQSKPHLFTFFCLGPTNHPVADGGVGYHWLRHAGSHWLSHRHQSPISRKVRELSVLLSFKER